MSTTVRISEHGHRRLRELARTAGKPLQEVLDQAVEALWRQRFFDELDAGYERLWADPVAEAAEIADRRLWENTLMDGLEDD